MEPAVIILNIAASFFVVIMSLELGMKRTDANAKPNLYRVLSGMRTVAYCVMTGALAVLPWMR